MLLHRDHLTSSALTDVSRVVIFIICAFVCSCCSDDHHCYRCLRAVRALQWGSDDSGNGSLALTCSCLVLQAREDRLVPESSVEVAESAASGILTLDLDDYPCTRRPLLPFPRMYACVEVGVALCIAIVQTPGLPPHPSQENLAPATHWWRWGQQAISWSTLGENRCKPCARTLRQREQSSCMCRELRWSRQFLAGAECRQPALNAPCVPPFKP